MNTRRDAERGETLVEIIMSIVVLGLIASATFYVITLGSTTSKSHRDYVTADALLRDAAEATKNAVRTGCANGGTTYSVAYSALPAAPDTAQNWFQYYHTARQFTLPTDIPPTPCPPTTGAVNLQAPIVRLSVTLPDNTTLRTLDIAVRSP